MISDTPGRGGRGVKKGQIFADVLYGWPLSFSSNDYEPKRQKQPNDGYIYKSLPLALKSREPTESQLSELCPESKTLNQLGT